MKLIAALLFLFSSLFLSAQTEDYLILEGKIGKYPVTMELLKQGEFSSEQGAYFGSYYYHSQEIPIELYQSAPQLAFSTYDDGEFIETFSGTYANDTFKGTWKKGEKNLPFELKKVPKESYTEILHHNANKEIIIPKEEYSDTVKGSYEIDFYLPKDLKLQRELVQNIDSTYLDFQSFSRKNIENFERDYRAEVEDIWENSSQFYASMYNHQIMESFSPYLNGKDYLVMRYFQYLYTGGAHGMSFEIYYTYDKRKNKWLEISDVLDLKHTKEINNILDKAVRKEHNIPAGVKLNEPETTPFLAEEIYYSKNFSLSQKGITFHYGLYEMTPYAYGYFELFVPYDDLKPYLRKDFKY